MHPNNKKIIFLSFFLSFDACVCICVYVFVCLAPPKTEVSASDFSSPLEV